MNWRILVQLTVILVGFLVVTSFVAIGVEIFLEKLVGY